MKKILSVLLALAAASVMLSAKDTTRVAYMPSRFADNWFVQAGGGVNTVFNAARPLGPVSGAAELFLGKWITPSFGLRAGAAGYMNRPNGTETGWFSGRDPFWFGHADVDIMWSVFNSFRYNEHRFWDVVPYARMAGIYTNMGEGGHWEPGIGAGVHNGLRLSKHVDLYLEASAVAARETAYRERGNIIVFPRATAGVVVRFGRLGFRTREAQTVIREIERTKEVVRVERDTVVREKTVVDSVLIKELREHPLTLYFELDQTVLTQRELDHLERYALYVLNPDSKVLLTGSADKETGDSSHNQWLSEQRNAFVRNVLIRVYGLKPENISEVANGDRKNEFRTKEQNRCVTISFIE